MNMHDNDMDKLFRSKLDSYEVEPSANVWAGISKELGTEPKRKSIVPLLRIAAGITVIISAGLFFLTKKQVDVQPVKAPKLAINQVIKPSVAQQGQLHPQTRPVYTTAQTAQIATIKTAHKATVVNGIVIQAPVVIPQPVINTPDQTDASVSDQAHLMASVPTNISTNVSKAVVPVNSTPIVDKPADNTTVFTAGNTSTAATIAAVNDDAKPSKKRRFSLSKVLNTVIAVVDKRQDKLIEFADTDEGETITGINIGVLKVKKVE